MSDYNCGNIYGVDIESGASPTPFDCEDPLSLIQNPTKIECVDDCTETDCCEQLEETESSVSSPPTTRQNNTRIGSLCRICFYYQDTTNEINQFANEEMSNKRFTYCKKHENLSTSMDNLPYSDLISFYGFIANEDNDVYILTNSNSLEYFYNIDDYKEKLSNNDDISNTIILIRKEEFPVVSMITIYNNLGEENIKFARGTRSEDIEPETSDKIKDIYDEFRKSGELQNNIFDIDTNDPNTYDKLKKIINEGTDVFFRSYYYEFLALSIFLAIASVVSTSIISIDHRINKYKFGHILIATLLYLFVYTLWPGILLALGHANDFISTIDYYSYKVLFTDGGRNNYTPKDRKVFHNKVQLLMIGSIIISVLFFIRIILVLESDDGGIRIRQPQP